MTYAYLRYSTSHQDEVQQLFALDEYASSHGLTIDDIIKDEGISGGVSYKDRNLYKLVQKMQPGDILITTEISRLGRAMSDISKLLNDELKPRKARLIVIKMGIDVDCSNMKAQDDFLFSALSFAAQIEKEMIQQRTQSAIDARKEAIRKNGGFVSKRSGKWTKHLGRQKGSTFPGAGYGAGMASAKKANDWRKKSPLYKWVARQLKKNKPRTEILAEAQALYEDNPSIFCTREGKPLCKGTLSRWAKELRIGM